MKKFSTLLLTASLVLLFSGCSTTNARTEINVKTNMEYQNVVINDIKVYSEEDSAKTNAPLQQKFKTWQTYANNQLSQHVESSKYNLLTSNKNMPPASLLYDLDVNIIYGNRALRWAVGFGAGKGGVHSTLTVRDANTAKIIYQGKGDSELKGGGLGGDMDAILKQNIAALLKRYSMR